jgi:hypothetical protein
MRRRTAAGLVIARATTPLIPTVNARLWFKKKVE